MDSTCTYMCAQFLGGLIGYNSRRNSIEPAKFETGMTSTINTLLHEQTYVY